MEKPELKKRYSNLLEYLRDLFEERAWIISDIRYHEIAHPPDLRDRYTGYILSGIKYSEQRVREGKIALRNIEAEISKVERELRRIGQLAKNS